MNPRRDESFKAQVKRERDEAQARQAIQGLAGRPVVDEAAVRKAAETRAANRKIMQADAVRILNEISVATFCDLPGDVQVTRPQTDEDGDPYVEVEALGRRWTLRIEG